jgi:exosortase
MADTVSSARLQPHTSTAWYWTPYIAALLLIATLYGYAFSQWWWVWNESGSFYAHAMFVPVFVGMMVWRNRERLEAARWQPSWWGLVPLALAVVLVLLGKDSEVRMLQSVSFVLVVFSAVLLLLGPHKMKVLRFPLFFILTMIPLLPDQLINVVAFPIQMTSTRLAARILNFMMLPATAEGAMIQMDSYKMMVGSLCSGFRTLVSLLTFAGAFAYLVEGAVWKRWLLFIVTIPLSLLINSIRIALIGMVGELISARAASIFHDYSGLLVLLLAFWMLFNIARILHCDNFLGISLSDEPAAEAPKPSTEPSWWQVMLSWKPTPGQMRRTLPYILAMDGLLCCALVLDGKVFTPPPSLQPMGTSQVPRTISADGVTFDVTQTSLYDRLDSVTQDALKPTRVINRDYEGSDGSQLSLFITAGNLRHTFHDPHNCSLGADAVLKDVGVITIPTKYGPIQALESQFKQNGRKDSYEMLFLYVVDNKVVPTTAAIHRKILWQTVFGSSGTPSYFVRVTQRSEGTDQAHREQLIRFMTAVWDSASPAMLGKVPAVVEPPPVPAPEHA